MKKLMIILAILMSGCAAADTTTTNVAPTIDPFIAVAQAERTAEAAQEQADFYSRQLTATAEAPLIAMTATAGAWQMELAYASATSQSISATETAVMTQTAMAWTATPNATSTVVAAQAAAQSTQIANETRLSDLEVERARTTNMVRAASMYVIGFVALVLALVWGIGLARKYSVYAIPTNEHGDKAAILIDGIVMDADRLPNGMAQMSSAYVAKLPLITSDRQDLMAIRDQEIDLKSRTRVTNAALERFMKDHALIPATAPAIPARIPETVVTDEDINLPLPPWEFMDRWDGNSKPLGFGRTGLITAKSASPHILISGMTGSGKTLYMMRTLTVASLSKGSQVINIGYSNAGYGVFEKHVNFVSVQLDDPSNVIECLAQVYAELKLRKEIIGGETLEWDVWPGGQPPRPFLDVHLDELGNMAEDIFIEQGPSANREMWSYVSRIANEGRKFGIRFVAALQDPTSKSIDLRFRRNCTLVSFRQGDRTQSDTFIGRPGAEQLSVGHFMARTDAIVVGGGFSPSDDEILKFLSTKPVQPTEKPQWIEGVAVKQIEAEKEPTPITIHQPMTQESLPGMEAAQTVISKEALDEAKVLDLYGQNKSMTAIIREVWGASSGAAYYTARDKYLAILAKNGTSSAASEPEMPENAVFQPA